MAKLSLIVRQLDQLIPAFGSNTDVGQAVMKAAMSLGKHVNEANVSPGIENQAMSSMANRMRQMGPQVAALRAAQAQAQPQAQPAGGA